jgi:Domain of unknown function (DUF6362)
MRMKTMAEWALVEKRLRQAVALRELMAAARYSEDVTHRVVTAPQLDSIAVELAANALSWLRWLEQEEASLVLARLQGARWKLICWRFGISRPTAYRRWRHALQLIAWRLNGRAVPTGCSRRRFAQLSARM